MSWWVNGSLRVAIGGLRKALGDGQDGMRYIATVAGTRLLFCGACRSLDNAAIPTGTDAASRCLRVPRLPQPTNFRRD